MMKYASQLWSFFLILIFAAATAQASAVVKEMNRVAGEVAELELGFGDYVLGRALTPEQKKLGQKNSVKKSLQGTYKFKDGEVFVVAAWEGDIVLGVYKQYPDTTMNTVKSVIGGLMIEYGEPTAMAHDKLVYWTYNKDGRIPQDVFDFERQNGGADNLATVKFSSSERIITEEDKEKAENIEQKKLSAYVMITSDPLSKLFLAYTTPSKTVKKQ